MAIHFLAIIHFLPERIIFYRRTSLAFLRVSAVVAPSNTTHNSRVTVSCYRRCWIIEHRSWSSIMKTLAVLSPRSSNPIVEVPEIVEMIESQAWTEIIRKLQDEPAEASIKLDSPTGASNLAIHEACKHQPPVAVIDSLIKANPSSVMAKGQWGYLPIHFA